MMSPGRIRSHSTGSTTTSSPSIRSGPIDSPWKYRVWWGDEIASWSSLATRRARRLESCSLRIIVLLAAQDQLFQLSEGRNQRGLVLGAVCLEQRDGLTGRERLRTGDSGIDEIVLQQLGDEPGDLDRGILRGAGEVLPDPGRELLDRAGTGDQLLPKQGTGLVETVVPRGHGMEEDPFPFDDSPGDSGVIGLIAHDVLRFQLARPAAQEIHRLVTRSTPTEGRRKGVRALRHSQTSSPPAGAAGPRFLYAPCPGCPRCRTSPLCWPSGAEASGLTNGACRPPVPT